MRGQKVNVHTVNYSFLIAILLIIPSYWSIAGASVTYFAPIAVLVVHIFMQRGKICISKRIDHPMFWCFYLYTFVVSVIDREIFYAVASTFALVGVAWLILSVIKSKEDFDKFIDCIVILLFVVCILGIIEAITSVNLFQFFAPSDYDFFEDYRMGHIRIMGQFAQPIVYAYFLLLMSPLVVYRISGLITKKRYFTITVYIMIWVNVFLTSSRAVMVAFVVLQFVFLYMIGYKKMIVSVTTALLIIFVTAILLVFLSSSARDYIERFFGLFSAIFGKSSSETYSGLGDRLRLIPWVIEKVGDNIWFGNGIDVKFNYEVYEWHIKESIENEYLNMYFHCGLVGVVAEIVFFVSNIYFCLQRKTKNHPCLLKMIAATLIVFYTIILTAAQSSAVTAHVFLITLAIAYSKLYVRGEIK